MAAEFLTMLKDFGIKNKILSITCDNNTNNDKMVTRLGQLIEDFVSENRTHYFLYITNLIAWQIIAPFDIKSTCSNNEQDNNNDEAELSYLAAENSDADEPVITYIDDGAEDIDNDSETWGDNNMKGWVVLSPDLWELLRWKERPSGAEWRATYPTLDEWVELSQYVLVTTRTLWRLEQYALTVEGSDRSALWGD
ncbi:hypothetical protein FISHEDRAFT_76371 [Fistulina hepatica ATCC 64428]|uniref:DUF659 domain-containing protein n=1 Tax=Fistulina hepatica ATCC 64428 TaxID=1128425 RepID=A0A0D7A7E6_9AGAR|nr:hypothetical protein FISHEDRAFT_76371 [Fistulina hepatica ATCC 64428]